MFESEHSQQTDLPVRFDPSLNKVQRNCHHTGKPFGVFSLQLLQMEKGTSEEVVASGSAYTVGLNSCEQRKNKDNIYILL